MHGCYWPSSSFHSTIIIWKYKRNASPSSPGMQGWNLFIHMHALGLMFNFYWILYQWLTGWLSELHCMVYSTYIQVSIEVALFNTMCPLLPAVPWGCCFCIPCLLEFIHECTVLWNGDGMFPVLFPLCFLCFPLQLINSYIQCHVCETGCVCLPNVPPTMHIQMRYRLCKLW